MNAYAKFKPYDKNFYTDAFAHGVKGDGTADFDLPLRANSQVEKLRGGGRRFNKTLEDGKAMYLYGGRKALIREFAGFKSNYGDFVLTPASGKSLAVFHGKITVDRNKTKRILMIANTTNPPPADVSGRRLNVDLYDYQIAAPGSRNSGFYNHLDLAGLDRIVRAIPD